MNEDIGVIVEKQHTQFNTSQRSKDSCDLQNWRIVHADSEFDSHVKHFQRESQEFDRKIAEALSRDSHRVKTLAGVDSKLGQGGIHPTQVLGHKTESPLTTGSYSVGKIRSKRKSQDIKPSLAAHKN